MPENLADPSHAPAALIAPPRLRRAETLLLVVDVQERLIQAMSEGETVIKNSALLARAARQLQSPIIATEQYPAKLGVTVPEIAEHLTEAPYPKMLFSACTDEVRGALHATGRRTALLCGIEAHVCLLQSALDLIEDGFTVFVARDAISSRTLANKEVGWQRLMAAGALPTSTESAIFELLREAGTSDFKALLPWIK